MPSRRDIEIILFDELERKRQAADRARKYFHLVVSDIPSGLPQPDGTQRIVKAKTLDSAARDNYALALREFNNFIIHGELPARFKDANKRASSGR